MGFGAPATRPRWRSARFPPSGVLLLTLVFAFGVTVRLLGIRLGLPFFHHWDEVWVVSSAQQMLEQGSDLPTSYQYGAPMSRLMAIVVEAWEALGLPQPAGGFRDDVGLRWVGRGVGVAICSTGILASYVAGRAAGRSPSESRRLGLYAALAHASAYELVTHARYAVTDACLVAFVAWSLAACGQYIRTRKLAWAALAVLAAGLAFAFKPTAGPSILLPLVTLAFVRPPSPPSYVGAVAQRVFLLSAFPAFLGCFLFFNPHYIAHWQDALRDLTMRIAQTKNGGFPTFLLREPGLDHLATTLAGLFGHTLSRLPWISWLLSVVTLVGAYLAIRERRLVVLVGLAHAAAVVLLISLPNRTFLLRNYLVAVPAICLALALGLDGLVSRLRERVALPSAVFVALPILVLLLPSFATLRDSLENQRLDRDARERALRWIDANAASERLRVGLTPSVFGKTALGAHRRVRSYFDLPRLGYASVERCPELDAKAPDYIVSASYRGDASTWSPYVETWHLQSCPGYRQVASFEANPYEHTYWVTETWDGRVSAIVLEREGR